MNEHLRKSLALNIKLKPIEQKLLFALSHRQALNYSEVIRQALRNEAERAGLTINGSAIVSVSLKEVQNEDKS